MGADRGPPASFRNPENGTAPRFARDTTPPLDLAPYSVPTFADLWGTGHIDLFSGGAGGGLSYYRSSRP